MDETVTCPKCGAEYTLRAVKIPMRDIDSITCDTAGCDTIIKHWNGGVMYTSKIVKPGTLPRA